MPTHIFLDQEIRLQELLGLQVLRCHFEPPLRELRFPDRLNLFEWTIVQMYQRMAQPESLLNQRLLIIILLHLGDPRQEVPEPPHRGAVELHLEARRNFTRILLVKKTHTKITRNLFKSLEI